MRLDAPAIAPGVVEGPHRLGTLGAAKVATSLLHLGDVVEALRRLDDYDDFDQDLEDEEDDDFDD